MRLGRTQGGQAVWSNSKLTNELSTGMYTYSRVNLHTLDHDLLLNEVRFYLEEVFGVVEWLDIRHMRADAVGKPFEKDFSSLRIDNDAVRDEIVPDSIFKHTREGVELGFSLELELSLKRNSRYDKLVENYFSCPSVSTVFFVVRNNLIRNSILRAGRRYYRGAHQKFAICTIEELLEGGEDTLMHIAESEPKPLHALLDSKGMSSTLVSPGVQSQDK